MRKLLSILAAVGLTATASTAVVACTASIGSNDVAVLQNGYTSISNKDITLPAELKESAAGTDLVKALNLKAFNNNGKDASDTVKDLKVTLVNKTSGTTKKDKKVKVNISFFLSTSVATKSNIVIKLGTAKGTGDMKAEAVKITAKTPMN